MLWDDRVGRRIRLKDLHTLQMVSELGSMAKASARLALSQPAISKSIADMEHILGAPLLDRSARGVKLTECGRLLVARGRIIFDELRLGVEEIEQRSDPTSGEVRIGLTEPSAGFAAEAISRLTAKFPRITYDVLVSDTTSLLRLLRERDLDVVITRWTSTAVADDLAAEILYKAPLGVLADRRHPLIGQKRFRLADLMDEPWTLSPPDSFLGKVVTEVFRARDLGLPAAVVTSLSIYMRLNLLANGRFLTMLPLRMTKQRANAPWLRAIDVDLPDTSGPNAAITVKKRSLPGAVKHFLTACRQAAEVG